MVLADVPEHEAVPHGRMETKVSVSLVYIYGNEVVSFPHLHGELRERLHLHNTLLPTQFNFFERLTTNLPLRSSDPSCHTTKAEDMIAPPSWLDGRVPQRFLGKCPSCILPPDLEGQTHGLLRIEKYREAPLHDHARTA